MPNALLIDGRAYPIRTDFRVGIEYQRIAAAGELTAAIFLSLWFPGDQPDNISAALDGVSRFLRRQDSPSAKEDSDGPTPYDLTVDSDVIATGFQQKYGIDLTDPETHLHWWRFAALLEGLCGQSFARRVEIRTKDLSGMKAKERAQWMRLRNQYAIRKEAETYKDFIKRLDEIIARGGGMNG